MIDVKKSWRYLVSAIASFVFGMFLVVRWGILFLARSHLKHGGHPSPSMSSWRAFFLALGSLVFLFVGAGLWRAQRRERRRERSADFRARCFATFGGKPPSRHNRAGRAEFQQVITAKIYDLETKRNEIGITISRLKENAPAPEPAFRASQAKWEGLHSRWEQANIAVEEAKAIARFFHYLT